MSSFPGSLIGFSFLKPARHYRALLNNPDVFSLANLPLVIGMPPMTLRMCNESRH